jgi:FkbM family methyltransferase
VFEATPSKEQAILERVGGFGARVVLYMAAVGDVAGTAELHLPDGEGGAQQDSVSDQSFWTGKTKTIEVPMVRLDDVVAEHVDLLKIDAQGHDFRVLLGAETLIREHGVDIIHVEFAPRLLESAQSDPVAMLYWLRDRGYSCMDCDAFGPPGPFEARRFEDYPAAFSASAKDGREFGEWTDLLCYAIN